MKITWIGHACFKIEEAEYTVIIDPYKDGSVPGLTNLRETADLVLCSHAHGDHSGRECVQQKEGGISQFKVQRIATYHDDACGSKRGSNTIHILEAKNIRIAHLGDLGCSLDPDQIEILKNVDVCMIPVGGFFTINAEQAAQIVDQIQPGIVIPMHYRDDDKKIGYDVLDQVNSFIENMNKVETLETAEIEILSGQTQKPVQVVVLQPQNAE